jgi:CheY-like chemotaxis protein
MRILIVEDEGLVAANLANYLRESGYTTFIAESGMEALERIAADQPDIVLMDIRLKGDMDGLETSLAIYRTTRLPVIFVSAYADAGTLAGAASHPAGFVVKPYRHLQITASIEMALAATAAETECTCQ